MSRKIPTKTIILCIFSSILLVLSYPKFDFWFLMWGALIPFMFALDKKTFGQAFRIGFLCGCIFFGGTLYWFIHTTSSGVVPGFLAFLGTVLLVLYLSLYFGLFGCAWVLFRKRTMIWKLFLLPSAWVALEFLRDRLFTGFGWVSLGHSQYKILPLIQIVDVTGMFGISFLIVMVNYFLKETLTAFTDSRKESMSAIHLSFFILLSIWLFVFAYGMIHLIPTQQLEETKIAIVQGNVEQDRKWDNSAWPEIMEKYLALTEEAAETKPDIIIWPETAFPGYLWEAQGRFDKLKEFVADMKVPLLVGIATREGGRYHNSAILVSENGEEIAQYNKLHLVPFGEFIPFREQIPFISYFIPIGDFSPGEELTLFPIRSDAAASKPENKYFSVLVCFEDTVSGVSRKLVNNGANLLVNITNDGWFLDTKAPFLHLQASVFQAVQNRRSLVRATNTGVSCFVDQFGRIYSAVKDRQGRKTYISGLSVGKVAFNNKRSFYTKFGDIFTYLCFSCILLGVLIKKHH